MNYVAACQENWAALVALPFVVSFVMLIDRNCLIGVYVAAFGISLLGESRSTKK